MNTTSFCTNPPPPPPPPPPPRGAGGGGGAPGWGAHNPAGLVTPPAPGHWDGTLVNALVWHLQNAQGSGLRAVGKGPEPRAQSPESLPRAGIVHRLDKDTSGLLLAAKTDMALTSLGRQLKSRTMGRRYYALVEGHMPLDQGTVRAAIGRHARHRKEMTVRHLDGRAAVTHYRVMRRYGRRVRGQTPIGERDLTPPYTLLEIALDTGRTHQIRVHMAHLGHPVLGDATYGQRSAASWQALGIPRQFLHAYELHFQHPATGQSMTLTAPLPADMGPWVEGTVISGQWRVTRPVASCE